MTNTHVEGYYQYPDGTLYPATGYSELTLVLESAWIEADGNMIGSIVADMGAGPDFDITGSDVLWGSQLSSIGHISGNSGAVA